MKLGVQSGKKLLLVLTLVVALPTAYVAWQLHRSLELPEVLEVPRGTSVNSLLQRFAQQGIVGWQLPVKLGLRLSGVSSQIRSGDYQIPPGSSLLELLAALRSGQHQINYKFAIIEGQNWRETSAKLWELAKIDAQTANLGQRAILQLLEPGSSQQYLEGLLLADTYLYKRDSSDIDLLRQAYQAGQDLLQQLWEQRAEGLPITQPYEALILASIVEKETSLPSERARIAAVFYNRIRRNMRLQSDPTTIFGLGERFDGNLKRSHLRDRSNPYNTYAHHGLPPTPIAMVGVAALQATLNPISSDELYFVSRGDGSHQFSTNLKDHNRAVRRYQLGRR